LFLFPMIGHAFGMSQNNFGLWAALAIHDTSSVVGAAAAYGDKALAVGTTVKLSRALWIIPIALVFSMLERKHQAEIARANQLDGGAQALGENHAQAKIQIPWFIGFFILASVSRTFLGSYTDVMSWLTTGAKALLSLTLFFIGAGLSRSVLKKVGYQPLALGIALWVIVAVTTLTVILAVK
jgi:uncharacterized membrane protein YadS